MLKKLKYIFIFTTLLFTFYGKSVGASKCDCTGMTFVADKSVVCAPDLVTFNVIGYKYKFKPTKFEWKIGNGAWVVADSVFKYLFTKDGYVKVSVRFTLATSSTCTCSKDSVVLVRSQKGVDLKVSSPVSCHKTDTITVFDRTLKTKSREYVFNGKSFKNVPNPFKIPASSTVFGPRSIFVFVEDSFGCTSTINIDTLFTQYKMPILGIDPTKDKLCVGDSINFKVKFSNTIQQIDSVKWEFDNADPYHSDLLEPKNIKYRKIGAHTVKYTLKTKEGCIYNQVFKGAIEVGDTTPLDIFIPPKKYCAGSLIQLGTKGKLRGSYEWEFTPKPFKEIQNKSHVFKGVFKKNATYTLVLKNDYFGCISTKTYNNIFTVAGPIARQYVRPKAFCAVPKVIAMNSNNTYPAGVANEYRWEVLDSNKKIVQSSSSKNFNPSLRKFGKYYVRHIAGAVGQCRDTARMDSIFGAPLRPDFLEFLMPVCTGKRLKFRANTAEGEPGKVNSHIFTFYDLDGKNILSTQHADTVGQVFYKTGFYNFKLVAYNKVGCKDSMIFKDTIRIGLPEYTLSMNKTSVCAGEPFKPFADPKYYYNNTDNYWEFQHVDSAKIKRVVFGDSALMAISTPGKYKVVFHMKGKTPDGCIGKMNFPTLLKVSGTKYNIKADIKGGCSPLLIDLTANKFISYNYTGNNKTPTFKWSVLGNKFVNIYNINQQNTDALLRENNKYKFKLVYTDESGCKDSAYSPLISSGVRAYYDFRKRYVCKGNTEQFINKSDLDPTGFKWIVDKPGSVKFLPNETTKSPKIKFLKEGKIKVSLIAQKGTNCNDTFTKTIDVINIRANFTADSISFCAPKNVKFRPEQTRFIYKMIWDYGDGSKDTLPAMDADHIYAKNTPKKGIKAGLIVHSYLGCSDTVIKPNYIKVIGPIADYSILNKSGCEPLTVTFINKSSAFNTALLVYGDNQSEYLNKLGTHTYRITSDKGKEFKKFGTNMILKDTIGNGCKAEFSLPDSVFVLKSPESDFDIKKKVACSPARINFSNLTVIGKPTISYWDFDNDGVIDSRKDAPDKDGIFTFRSGVYYPRLITKNKRGCSDTMVSKDSIIVYQSPTADFVMSGDTICSKDIVQFTDKSKYFNKALAWSWDFGEIDLFTDISFGRHPTYKYTSPFTKIITLNVSDDKGCKGFVQKSLFVLDTLAPPSDGLWAVSVNEDNNEIEIKWPQYLKPNFESYELFEHKAVYKNLYLTTDRKDTSYIQSKNIEVSKRRYCFSIRLHDSCGKVSPYSINHCNVYLRVLEGFPGSLDLKWVHYEGWDKVVRYNIYRKEQGKSDFTFLAVVSGNISNYTDSGLCDKEYCYYIEAVAPNEKTTANSNRACNTPLYIKPTIIPQMLKATVVNNNYVSIFWKPYGFKYFNLKGYAIDRFSKTSGGIKNFGFSTGTNYIDNKIDVSKDEYVYQVRAVDKCDHSSPPSGISTNILANGQTIANKASIVWSPYEKWQSGIKKYYIQQKINGLFVTIDSVKNTLTKFTTNEISADLADSLPFRILAVKDSSVLDTSISNNIYIIPSSIMYVPTAFSPNKDGKNEIFKPATFFINKTQNNELYLYTFAIYNRWGNKVFETHNPEEGWDGTFMGVNAPADNYIFIVNAVGLDGIVQKQKGNFLLLR